MQFNSLSKIATAVLMLCEVALGFSSYAAETQPKSQLEIILEYNQCKNPTPEKKAICDDLVNKAATSSFGGNNCREAEKSYREAYNKFSESCSKAGMRSNGFLFGSSSSTTSDVECSGEVRACLLGCDDFGFSKAELSSSSSTWSSQRCSDLGDPADAESLGITGLQDSLNKGAQGQLPNMTSVQSLNNPRITEAKARYASCSAQAAAGYKDAKDEFKDWREKMRDGQKRAVELQGELADLQNELKEAENKFENARDDLEMDFKRNLKALQDRLKEVLGKVAEQIIRLENVITQAGNALRDMDIEEQKVAADKGNKILALKQQCLASALQALAVQRAERAKAIQSSTFSAGEITNLWKVVGQSPEKREQYYVDRMATNCERGQAFKNNLQAIENEANVRLAQIKENRRRLQETIDRAELDIGKLKTSDRLQVLQEHEAEVKLLQEGIEKAFSRLAKERETTLNALNQKIALKTMDIDRENTHLREDQMEYEEAKQIFNLARKYSNGRTTTADAFDSALSFYGMYRSAAENIIGSCDCCKNSSGSSYCKQAANHLSGSDSLASAYCPTGSTVNLTGTSAMPSGRPAK